MITVQYATVVGASEIFGSGGAVASTMTPRRGKPRHWPPPTLLKDMFPPLRRKDLIQEGSSLVPTNPSNWSGDMSSFSQ